MRGIRNIFVSIMLGPLLGLLALSLYASDSINEFRRLYSKDIQEYGVLMQEVERQEGELKMAHENFMLQQCDSSEFAETAECKKIKADIRRFSRVITRKRQQIVRLKLKLKDYLDFTHGAIEDAKVHLAAAGDSSEQISSALSCLQTLGALTWGAELNTFYTQGMRILRHKNRQQYFEHLRSLPGFSNSECTRDDQVECWQVEGGIYYYVARGHIRISEGCLIRQAGVSNPDWSTFPSNPRDYLEAARQAAQTVAQKKGCYTSINKEKSESLSYYFETKRPRIQCTPERELEKKSSEGERCAYTHSGSFDLFLTAPNLCGGLARTLFHESMHADGSIDNLQVHHHNNSVCRSYDAIYHCAYLCFPERPQPTFLHQRGCNRCVAEDQAESLCAKFPDDLGPGLQMCGWGGQ